MTNPVRSVLLTALALLVVGVVIALVKEGGHFAVGVLLSGLLPLLSLGAGALALQRAEQSAHASSRALAAPFLLKLPLLLGAGWLLLTYFPPLSVVIGAGVLVASITMNAALGNLLPGAARKA